MTAVDELVAYLRRALDEDERKVVAMEREEHRVKTAPIFQGHPLGWLDGVDIFVSPERWRAEVVAKRRILDECADTLGEYDDGNWLAKLVIKQLAQPYAGGDGWREEWAVEQR